MRWNSAKMSTDSVALIIRPLHEQTLFCYEFVASNQDKVLETTSPFFVALDDQNPELERADLKTAILRRPEYFLPTHRAVCRHFC